MEVATDSRVEVASVSFRIRWSDLNPYKANIFPMLNAGYPG